MSKFRQAQIRLSLQKRQSYFFSHASAAGCAAAPSMVKKHQPSNGTCSDPLRVIQCWGRLLPIHENGMPGE
jgi:hypothetical protein